MPQLSANAVRDEKLTPPAGGSMSIETFCQRNEISRSFYYKMKKDGVGPVEMRYGEAVRISYKAEAEWIARGERRTKEVTAA
jgi:hypothetical protein